MPTWPCSRSSRRARRHPIVVLADVAGEPTSPANIEAVTAYAASIDAIDGIDRVEGPFAIRDPQTGTELTTDAGGGAVRPPRRTSDHRRSTRS